MDLFGAVNEVYGRYFSGKYPARETVAVKTLPKNVNVEISVIAAL
jgi:2-iminobutanoate/2-iminopropanoate deaminase